MRYLCFLLAFIMLTLSCIPCSDAKSTAMEQTAIHTQAKPTSGHTDKTGQEHKDLCSPFCQCSCCAFAYMVPLALTTEVLIKPSFSDKVFAAYLQQNPIGITLPVWQPPKIADRY